MAPIYYFILSLSTICSIVAAYTLKPSEFLTDGRTLTSRGGTFELGFFSPSTKSKLKYLGIWYKTISVQTVVWVANRDSPLNDTSGVLKINSSGNLVIVADKTGNLLWTSNVSNVVENPILEFLESGNLVLRDLRSGDSDSYFWQSFDYPSNTLLPGMKLGWNLKTGINRYLSSWKNFDDPSHGDYIWGLELGMPPEFVMRKGHNIYHRAGPWNGLHASGSPQLIPNFEFTYEYVDTDEEMYFMYDHVNKSNTLRFVLEETRTQGTFQFVSWVHKSNSWVVRVLIPRDSCDEYATCGAYSTCDVNSIEVCQCLKGFNPISQEDWSRSDWSRGCKRHVPLTCSKSDRFRKVTGVKVPKSITGSWVNKSMTLEECRRKCLNNCSCTAIANSDVRKGGSGCILWFSELLDMRYLAGVKQDFYIRMVASEIVFEVKSRKMKYLVVLIVSITSVGVLSLVSYCVWRKGYSKDGIKKDDLELLLRSKRDEDELILYDLGTIIKATKNFSEEYKLGEGGFGAVYKGMLNGEEVAVKRLSKSSLQGLEEFKNEVILLSKLQHRNLVRILGCCIEGEEKMLIYDYMENNSLDSFIFDDTKGRELDWQKRSQIILGIARGLLYLHEDSRLRIIHRDLKASNVLLDCEMVAKISDFGMARTVGGNQIEARSSRVAGTRGYMSPEYAVSGQFSLKSDVFAFGVLILEITSGKRNWGFSHPDHRLNLLGHAWWLWSEGKSIALVDNLVYNASVVEDISRCIQIGLLCVQTHVRQRPTMSSVVLMLSSESVQLPQPQPPPGFYMEMHSAPEENLVVKESSHSNLSSITLLEGR